MLDARITIIDGTMTKFDRSKKMISFIDKFGADKSLNYDILVLTLGLADKTIADITYSNKEMSNDKSEKIEKSEKNNQQSDRLRINNSKKAFSKTQSFAEGQSKLPLPSSHFRMICIL